MPHQVSGFNPQTWALALKYEHWYKIFWKNPSPSGIPSPKCVNCVPHREIDEPLECGRRSCSWSRRQSNSGWIPSLKTGAAVRQPFCSQLEERLMLWLEYHPQVKSYARGDIGPQFATTYRLPIPKHAPFAIGYTF